MAMMKNSDLVRGARREMQNQPNSLEATRVALIEGEKSGTSSRTPNAIINAVIEKRRKRGAMGNE